MSDFSFWFARKRQIYNSGLLKLNKFCSFKKKNEVVRRGLEPLAVEIDGEREVVNASERALHREATVTLNKFQKIFNKNTFGAIV